MHIQGKKFLVVDDHFLSRQMVSVLLKAAGATQIDTANDGQLALDRLDEALAGGAPYDILFLDWSMPNMDGHAALLALRARPQFDKLAIVMLTAESEEINIVKLLQAGATAYLPKPLTAEALTAKLADLDSWFSRQPVVQA